MFLKRLKVLILFGFTRFYRFYPIYNRTYHHIWSLADLLIASKSFFQHLAPSFTIFHLNRLLNFFITKSWRKNRERMNATNYITFTTPFTTPIPSNETSILSQPPTVGDVREFGHFKGGVKFLIFRRFFKIIFFRVKPFCLWSEGSLKILHRYLVVTPWNLLFHVDSRTFVELFRDRIV